MNEVEIKQVDWQEMEPHLRHIRTRVFIEEQNVPEELEWDEDDKDGIHLLVKMDDDFIATARLLTTGQIGRMAVLKPYRQCGIGSKMLIKILSMAEAMSMKTVFLNAQIDAMRFYNKFGFQEQGDVFDDAGIPHLKMYKTL
jgi:predicted GNAT family N-acyltransferase